MFGLAEHITKFLTDSIKYLKLELAPHGEILGDLDVIRGMFQGDSLSRFPFLCMIYMSLISRKAKGCYE